ncbi:MAG: hypothetical protein IPM21_04780 [Acidobacteria bacterium]|nr:hypothetical protein [Acidobacteriota bacterium]
MSDLEPQTSKNLPETTTKQNNEQSLCQREGLGSLDILGLPVVNSPEQQFDQFIRIAESELAIDPNLKTLQRNPSSYSLQIRETEHFVFALLSPIDRGHYPQDGSGESEIARDVLYTICKADRKIVGRSIFK